MIHVDKEVTSIVHLFLGVAEFLSEKVPYSDLKFHLKKALLSTEDNLQRSMLLHNLAVLNYCEIQDHNEKIELEGQDKVGDYLQKVQLQEDMHKDSLRRSKLLAKEE
eukprot:CAMPEP_0170490592 /NCGR_PEP_ID=MMETSP0208-20121228/8748_1 /TAXON_ID=197538 /ORGANISM="Strombidium inclinatum, Strain S3" /LENGTH=106 /DNA_ID=CAMNT_0010766027 /DNA_START=963 /DNA_END=1283 /DNA_ORIENTATION=-